MLIFNSKNWNQNIEETKKYQETFTDSKLSKLILKIWESKSWPSRNHSSKIPRYILSAASKWKRCQINPGMFRLNLVCSSRTPWASRRRILGGTGSSYSGFGVCMDLLQNTSHFWVGGLEKWETAVGNVIHKGSSDWFHLPQFDGMETEIVTDYPFQRNSPRRRFRHLKANGRSSQSISVAHWAVVTTRILFSNFIQLIVHITRCKPPFAYRLGTNETVGIRRNTN